MEGFSLWVSKFVHFIDNVAHCTEGQACSLFNFVAYMEHSCVIRLLVLWNELGKTNYILHQGFVDFPTVKEPLQIWWTSRVIWSQFQSEEPPHCDLAFNACCMWTDTNFCTWGEKTAVYLMNILWTICLDFCIRLLQFSTHVTGI